MPYPFIGPTYQTQSRNVGVERLINLYCEVSESPGNVHRATFYGTPGLKVLAQLGDAPGRGLFAQDGRCWAIVGGSLYEITYSDDDDTAIGWLRGHVANDGKPVSMASNGQHGHQLFIVSGGKGYILDLNTDALTEITTNFPAIGTSPCLMGCYLDGYFVALWPDHFQVSELFNGLNWSGADVGQLQITSDQANALVAHHRELWIFGERSTAVWYHTGTGNPPFAPVPGVLINVGTSSPWTIIEYESGLAWLAQDAAGARQVVFAQQYNPQRISSHAVEWALSQYEYVDDFRGYAYQEGGHVFLVFTSPLNEACWVFDLSVPRPFAWSERAWWDTDLGRYEAPRQIAHSYFQGQHLMLDRETGHFYRQQLGIYDDNGVPIRSLRRLPHTQPNNRWAFFSRFELLIEPGVGVLGAGEPQLMLRWSDDGGYTWSSEYWVTAGAFARYGTRAVWHRLGRSRDRIFEVVQTDAVKRAWIAAHVVAQPEAA